MKSNTSDLTVFVSGVIVDAFSCVAAAGVDGLFIERTGFYAALLLCHGAENVKNLADAGGFTIL